MLTRLQELEPSPTTRLGLCLRRWTKLWKQEDRLSAELVASELKADRKFGSLLDLLPGPDSTGIAIYGSDDSRAPLSHASLVTFLRRDFDLRKFGVQHTDVCALVLPESPELAVALLGTCSVATALPLNPWAPAGEIKADLLAAGAKAVIFQAGEAGQEMRQIAVGLGLIAIELAPLAGQAGLFAFAGRAVTGDHAKKWNGFDDIALTLFTSGSTGQKKRVPIKLLDLCVGAACLAAALELRPDDCGYSMMPLFHVGGIVRNLIAPMLAGSRMVYASGFDPSEFWDELTLETRGVNWYYGSPTIHAAVLTEGAKRPWAAPRLRFICNAAGALAPDVASLLRERFKAAVLPGYGMTECMPIACPPLDYRLERTGTSGRVLAAELQICDSSGRQLPAGQAGRIRLKGCPVSRGEITAADSEPSQESGYWFETGDLGYLDDDGYLYVTGREKEVIKRGGETIAPAEIEAALVEHAAVSEAVAFAIPHRDFQEVVGAIIVSAGSRRADLSELTKLLAKRLHPAKFPVALVYMDKLPKTATQKAIRIGLASRFELAEVDLRAPARTRLFEAMSPPAAQTPSTDLTARPVAIDPRRTQAALQDLGFLALVDYDTDRGILRALIEGADVDTEFLRKQLHALLDDYLVPDQFGVVARLPDEANIDDVFAQLQRSSEQQKLDDVEQFVVQVWREELKHTGLIRLESDFFDDLGGDSLAAVGVVVRLRDRFAVELAATALFKERTVHNLAQTIKRSLALSASTPTTANVDADLRGQSDAVQAKLSTSWHALLVQSLPLLMFTPVLRMLQFILWVFVLLYVRSHVLAHHHLAALLVSIAFTQLVLQLLIPLAVVLAKWILVGRYRASTEPLWGSLYLRWWLVRQLTTVAGQGVFAASFELTAFYYRLLGAKIGKNTKIHPEADLGEYDLVTIGDGVVIDEAAIVRPFSLVQGAMSLKPIAIGNGCSIGIRAIVVPGAAVAEHQELAPLASSNDPHGWQVGTRELSRLVALSPPTYLQLLGTGIKAGLLLLSWIPVLLVAYDYLLAPLTWPSKMLAPSDLLAWLLSPKRLVFYFVLHIAYATISPFLYLLGVILVKWTVIGRFKAEPNPATTWAMFERWLMWQLLPNGRFANVAMLVGANFGLISWIYRLLGAKVGKRVYWPGSGNLLIEYDLFEVGDDVTFGSRSAFLMSSTQGSKGIKLEAGANVADRCVLSPGTVIGRNAVLGSGTFVPQNFVAPPGSTWVGSGDSGPVCLEAASTRKASAPTLRPYGVATSQRQAGYFVWPVGLHALFNVLWISFSTVFRAAPFVGAQLLTMAALTTLGPTWNKVPGFAVLLISFYAVLHLVAALAVLAVTVGTKWLLLARRTVGKHFWHQSSYCQRWKIHCMLSTLRSTWVGGSDVLTFLEGSAYLVWYFRALGAKIGRNVCLYPNGADPMMEEPDLVSIDDHATIDQAVLIAHLNTRGEWELGPIKIGARACLRSFSRVMNHGKIAAQSVLLERTLVLAGDATMEKSTWSGWPGQRSI